MAAARLVDRAPDADGVEVLEREAERVHQRVAARAARIARDAPRAARGSSACGRSPPESSRSGTSGGGGGGGTPSRFSRIHLPRTTGEVRSGIRRDGQDAAVAEQAAARAVGRQRHAAEVIAFDVRQAVEARDALVDERVVGAQQIERAAILLHDAAEEELRLALRALAQRVVEVREIRFARARRRRGCADTATAPRSSRRTPSRARRPACAALAARALAGRAARRARRPPSSSSSGMLLQRKNDSRDASVRSDTA